MTRAIYLVGAPGVGKSTVMEHILEGWVPGEYVRWTKKEMFGHYLLHPTMGWFGAYMGHLRDEYPGTDALSLSVAPQALIWLMSLNILGLDWIFGEGARLSHPLFLDSLRKRAELTVVHLTASPEVLSERREARGGKVQTDQYCAAAATKATNTAARCKEWGVRVLTIESEGDPAEVAKLCLQ